MCYRTSKHTVCRCMCASFSPEIIHAGAVKGLSVTNNTEQQLPCHQCAPNSPNPFIAFLKYSQSASTFHFLSVRSSPLFFIVPFGHWICFIVFLKWLNSALCQFKCSGHFLSSTELVNEDSLHLFPDLLFHFFFRYILWELKKQTKNCGDKNWCLKKTKNFIVTTRTPTPEHTHTHTHIYTHTHTHTNTHTHICTPPPPHTHTPLHITPTRKLFTCSQHTPTITITKEINAFFYSATNPPHTPPSPPPKSKNTREDSQVVAYKHEGHSQCCLHPAQAAKHTHTNMWL